MDAFLLNLRPAVTNFRHKPGRTARSAFAIAAPTSEEVEEVQAIPVWLGR